MSGYRTAGGMDRDRFLRRTGNLRVRRERRWKRLIRRSGTILTVAGLAAGTGFLVTPFRTLIFESELFRVRHLVFQARDHAGLAELTELARPVATGNLFRIDLAALEERIETHPWVRRARVRRKLPDTLQVNIQERRPRALARVDGRLLAIDSEGVAMEPDGDRPPGRFPVFVGLPRGKGTDHRDAYRRGIRLLAEIRSRYPHLAARIDKMDLGSPDAIDVYLSNHPAPLRLPPDDGLGMLPWYLKIHERIRARVPAPAKIDLRWRGQISVSLGDGRSREG